MAHRELGSRLLDGSPRITVLVRLRHFRRQGIALLVVRRCRYAFLLYLVDSVKRLRLGWLRRVHGAAANPGVFPVIILLRGRVLA